MHITGPINIFRLSGTIDNIEKNIYFMSDRHLALEYQSGCTNGITFSQYLFMLDSLNILPNNSIKFAPLKNKEQKIHVFIEYGKRKLPEKHLEKNYQLVIDNWKSKNIFKNIQFHLFDFRKLTGCYSFWRAITRVITDNDFEMKSNLVNHEYLNKPKSWLNFIKENSKYEPINNSKLYNYFSKLMNKWNHTKVRDVIIPKFIGTMNILSKCCDDMKDILSDPETKIKSIKNCYMKLIINQATLIDYALLRKILDKDEINNAIVYMGSQHVLHCMTILIKKFNFKITHIASNNSNLTIEEFEELLRKANSRKYLHDLEKEYFPNIIQCSDITSFPLIKLEQ